MSPWDILGWMLVALIALPILLKALIGLVTVYEKADRFTRRYIRHLKTRNAAPAVGQRWYGDDFSIYEVTTVYDDGRLAVRRSNAYWSDSPEQWRHRVRNQRLYLASTR